jgi:hypothetical protein
MHTAMSVDWRNFFLSQELGNGTLLEPHVFTALPLDGTEPDLRIAMGRRFRMGGGGGEVT